jgi:hypothetical protein
MSGTFLKTRKIALCLVLFGFDTWIEKCCWTVAPLAHSKRLQQGCGEERTLLGGFPIWKGKEWGTDNFFQLVTYR